MFVFHFGFTFWTSSPAYTRHIWMYKIKSEKSLGHTSKYDFLYWWFDVHVKILTWRSRLTRQNSPSQQSYFVATHSSTFDMYLSNVWLTTKEAFWTKGFVFWVFPFFMCVWHYLMYWAILLKGKLIHRLCISTQIFLPDVFPKLHKLVIKIHQFQFSLLYC